MRTHLVPLQILISTWVRQVSLLLLKKQLEALRSLPQDDLENTGLLFERVVVDMMDFGINDGILSSTDIPQILEKKGWDFGQVAAAWTVSTEPLPWDGWCFKSLDYLGGRNSLSKIWSVLREEKMTCKIKRKIDSSPPPQQLKHPRS